MCPWQTNTSKHWEQIARDAASRVEEDVRRVITYINDEVVPDIRRNSSHALRAAASELQKLAQHMDDRRPAAVPLWHGKGQAKILTHRRILAALSLQALLLGAAGCHKNTRVAYQPPPPPSAYPGPVETTRPTRPDTSTASAKPSPYTPSAPQPIPQGRVVSRETGTASWYGPPPTSAPRRPTAPSTTRMQ